MVPMIANADARREWLPEVLPAADRPGPDVGRLLMPGGEHREFAMVEGLTVRELIAHAAVPEHLWPMLRVYNHGALVQDWDGFTLRAGDRLLLAVVPQGGGGDGEDNSKGILGAVLTIAVAIFAPYAAGAIYSAAGGTLVAANAGIILTGLSAGITMVGAMVISALIKPPTISTGNVATSAAKSYSLSGQSNAPRPYGSCFVLYGRHKIMPALASNPDVDNYAMGSVLTALYDFGLGYLNLYDIRVGDVDVWQYSPHIVVHTDSLCRNLQLNFNRIGYDQYALAMQQNDPITIRTKTDTYCANLDIQFPRGIFQQAPKIGQLPFWADFATFWRPIGTTTWNEVPVDWYHGGMGVSYTESAGPTIQYGPPDEGSGGGFGVQSWYDYSPTTGAAELRAKSARWQAGQGKDDPYLRATPNTIFPFVYPFGPIDEASYFARYPEIRARGWTGTAQAHFEALGSREGREPGVGVTVSGIGFYIPSITPSLLHRYDQIFGTPDTGAYAWIEAGSPPPQPIGQTPFLWRMKAGEVFEEALYLARYPDAANAVAAGSVASGWDHFTRYGAFEGRDPYVRIVTRSVRFYAQWVGTYWMRIFLVFPSPGEYEIQIVRTDKIQDGSDTSISQSTAGGITAQFNESTVALLRSYQAGLPVQPRLRHTMLELRVAATDQLQGVIQNLSAICVSVLYVTEDGVTFTLRETRNPAWIALDMLTSEKNPKPIARSQIDWPSWIHLANVCDTLRYWVANGQPTTAPRYTCDIVVSDFMTVRDVVESVLSGCRSSLMLTTAGKWGVLHDEEKTVPRQLITPANSWGFSGARTFSSYPHALRVNFVNRDHSYVKDEVTVYADGYYEGNASIFETLDTFGITDYPHAWAYGRFMLAQGIQRSELFTVSMDVENLLVQRGDLVHVAHDVPRIGGFPSRIDNYGWAVGPNGGGLVHVNVDVSTPPTGYSIRRQDGTIITGAVLSSLPNGVFEVDNLTGVGVDDLIVLGEFNRVTQPYLVQRIAAGQDLSAELTLCKYVREVYDADIGALPPWEPGFGNDLINASDLIVTQLTVTSVLYYVNREPKVDVILNWITTGFGLLGHDIAVIVQSGARTALAVSHIPQSFTWTVDALRERLFFDIPLQLEVTPVATNGLRGRLAYVSIQITPDRTAPLPVPVFGANVQKEQIDLYWQEPAELDVEQYLLRYTPEILFPNWDASQHLANVGYPTTKTSAGARTGSYGLRVQDTSGNLSPVVWRRTTIGVLPDINVIEVVNDRDDLVPWGGKRSHVEVHGIEITSEGEFGAVYPEGIYYCKELVDLADVYETRISSKIEAYGVIADDYMAEWETLDSVLSMVSPTSGLWDAWVEVRTSNEMSFMQDWVTLTAIDPLSDANDSDWSPWRALTVGDFTGQLFGFRIRLQSNNPGVRVVVKSGRIEVDMPDRIDAFGNVAVPLAGLDFIFPVAFRSLKAVAITIDGTTADALVAVVTSKTPTGFHLQLVKAADGVTSLAGQVDILAKGYGRLRATSI